MKINIFNIQPYLLTNTIQHYAWGQKNETAYIPQLLNIQAEKDQPYAELWIGAHPKAPSTIMTRSLLELITEFPVEILGEEASKRFNDKLPFLLKVLSAGEALSIQAHPNKKQAEKLHANDPKHYPDDNHKPEIAIALDALTALVGFKTMPEIFNLLEEYSPIAEFVTLEVLKTEGLKAFYSQLMTKAETNPKELETILMKMDQLITDKKNKSETDDLYLELRQKYGTDVGLFSLYLFNLIHLDEGEAVFLKAGIPHAYLKGNIIECMANSDNVVRAGLTPKFKDITTLVDILTYETGIPEIISPTTTAITEYVVPIPEFSIIRKNINSGQELQLLNDRLKIFIITEGKITITSDGFSGKFKKGDTVMVPAALEEYSISAHESTTIYTAMIPEN